MRNLDSSIEAWLFLAPVLGVWAAVMAIHARRRIRRTLEWPSTKGIITNSVLIEGKGGTKARVTYEYFTPEPRIGFGLSPGGSLIANPAAFVKRFPKGTEVPVRFDPANPSDSFIDSGAHVQVPGLIVLAIFGLSFPPAYLLYIYLLK